MIQKGCRESDGQVRQGTVPPSVSVQNTRRGIWTGVLLYGKTNTSKQRYLSDPSEGFAVFYFLHILQRFNMVTGFDLT